MDEKRKIGAKIAIIILWWLSIVLKYCTIHTLCVVLFAKALIILWHEQPNLRMKWLKKWTHDFNVAQLPIQKFMLIEYGDSFTKTYFS